MVQATNPPTLERDNPTPGRRKPRGQTADQGDLVDLVTALRDVMMVGRRKAAGSAHDKSVFTLLAHLETSGPLRASELADHVGLDLSTVSRHLTSLEADGLVRRTPDPDDRRAYQLAVTKPGQRLVQEVRQQRLAMLSVALEGWSDNDRSELIRLTRQLADSLESL